MQLQSSTGSTVWNSVDALVGSIGPLFDDSPTFTAVVAGPDHVYQMSNAANNDLIGRTDLVGRSAKSAVPEAERQGLIEMLDGVLSSGVAFHAERVPCTFVKGSGELANEHVLSFVYAPIFGTHHKPIGVFIHGMEVTEAERAKLAVEALEQLGVTTLGWSVWKKAQTDFLRHIDRTVSRLDMPVQTAIGTLRVTNTLDEAKEVGNSLGRELARLQSQIRHVLDGLLAAE